MEHIIVADQYGNVSDTTLEELKGKSIPVPETETLKENPGDPVEGELDDSRKEFQDLRLPIYFG